MSHLFVIHIRQIVQRQPNKKRLSMTPSGYTVQDAARKLGINYKALLKRIERGSVTTSRLTSADQAAHIIPPEEFDRLNKIITAKRSTRRGGDGK